MNISNQLRFNTIFNVPSPMLPYWPYPVMVIDAAEVERVGELCIGNILVPIIPMTREEVERAEAFADLQAEAEFSQEEMDRISDDEMDGLFNRMADDANDFSPDVYGYDHDDEDMLFDGEDMALEAYPPLTPEQEDAIDRAVAQYQDMTGGEIISGEPFEPLQRIEGHTLGELLDSIDEKGVSMKEKFSLNSAINARFGAATCIKCNYAVHNCECEGGAIIGMDIAKVEEQEFQARLDNNLPGDRLIAELDNAIEDEAEKARPRCMFCGEDQADCLSAGGHDMNGDKVSR